MNRSAPPLIGETYAEPRAFSLVLGGPLYQLWRRTRLAGDVLELLHRRILAMLLLAWLPLLILSAAEGRAWTSGVEVPFLKDVEMQVRLLVAMPLLTIAELVVHQRLRPVVAQFEERGIIAGEERAKLVDAVRSAMRLRDSIPAELALIALVYTVGEIVTWRFNVVVGMTSWHGVVTAGVLRPSWAAWWMRCVSLPLFQFLLLRWYYRFFIWARFLWQVARLDLKLVATHPDRCGGLGFLSSVADTFSPVLVAQGVILAGMIASRILHGGAMLGQFKVEVVGSVLAIVLMVLAPLTAFAPRLAALRREGIIEIGALAQRYSREFQSKWSSGGPAPSEPLLGSADIQSLADMGNSYGVVNDIRIVPFTSRAALQLAFVTLAPGIPLLLTVFPLDELLSRLIQIVL